MILLARSQNSLSKKHWSDIIKEHPNTKLYLKFDVDKTWMDSKDYEKCHYLLHILGQFDRNCMSIYTKWWGRIMILKNFMVQGNKMPSKVMIILFIRSSNIIDPSNQIHSLKEITFTGGSCLFTCITKRLSMLVGPIFLKSFRNVSHHHPFYIFFISPISPYTFNLLKTYV